MKKNYLLVLFALLTFALNINAQESTDQEETYNMTVTLPDGTSLIVNTNDVDEVTFSEGKLNVSGTSVNEIVQKIRQVLEEIGANKMSIDEAKAYVENLVKMVNTLQTQVADLADATQENRHYAIEALDRTTVNANEIELLQTRLEFLESALMLVKSCMCDPQQAIEALTMAEEARKYAVDADSLAVLGIHMTQQNTDDIDVLKKRTESIECDIMELKDFGEMTRMELYDAVTALRDRADILSDSIASVLGEVSKAESLAQVALQVAYNIEERAYTLASTLEARVAALEQENAMLKNNAEVQQKIINDLTTTVAAQDANIANLQHVINELMQRVEALENK